MIPTTNITSGNVDGNSSCSSDFDSFVAKYENSTKIPTEEVRAYLNRLLAGIPKATEGRTDPRIERKHDDQHGVHNNTVIGVSWDGIHISWLLQEFTKLPEMQKFMEAGCRMWFLREYGILEILRRRDVTSGPAIENILALGSHGFGRTNCQSSVIPAGRMKSGNSGSSASVAGAATTNTMNKSAIPNDYTSTVPSAIKSKAKTFISFTGSYTIQHFMNCLQVLHEKIDKSGVEDDEECYVWIDTFCVDQFAWTTRSKEYMEEFTASLQNQIHQIGNTVLMLDAWDDIMETLNQLWVLWEVHVTSQNSKSKFDVLLSDTQLIKLKEELFRNHNPDGISDKIYEIDIENANYGDEKDRKMLLDTIKKDTVATGFNRVNQYLSQKLQSWIFVKGDEIVKSYAESYTYGHVSTQLATVAFANLCIVQAQYDKAEAMIRSIERHIKKNEIILEAKNSLGRIMEFGFKYKLEDAEQMYMECVEETEYNNMSYLFNLFRAACSLGRPKSTVEDLHRKLQKGQNDDRDQMETMRMYARWLGKQKLHDAAITHYEKVLNYCKGKWGSRHLLTLNTMYEISVAFIQRNRDDDLRNAEHYLRIVLQHEIEIYGISHGDTLTIMAKLGEVIHLQQRYDEAETFLTTACNELCDLLGEEHPKTKNAMCLLLDSFIEKLIQQNEMW